MKKKMPIILFLLIIPLLLNGKEQIILFFSGHYMSSADMNYHRVYTANEFFPEVHFGVRLFNNFFGWTGYGFLSADGKTYRELNLDTDVRKEYYSIGISYKSEGKTGFKLSTGLIRVNWEESAFNQSRGGSVFGFRFGGAFVYNCSSSLFFEISSSYMLASDKNDDVTLKLGGFIAGGGIGLRF